MSINKTLLPIAVICFVAETFKKITLRGVDEDQCQRSWASSSSPLGHGFANLCSPWVLQGWIWQIFCFRSRWWKEKMSWGTKTGVVAGHDFRVFFPLFPHLLLRTSILFILALRVSLGCIIMNIINWRGGGSGIPCFWMYCISESRLNTGPLSLLAWGKHTQSSSVLPLRMWHTRLLWLRLNRIEHTLST